MSEKGKRQANNGVSTSKAAPAGEGKKFAVGLQKIFSDFEVLCKSSDGVQDYGDLLASQAALKQDTARLQKEVEGLNAKRDEEVRELKRKIAGLEQYKDRLIVDYGEKYKIWDADKHRLTKELNGLAQLRKEFEAARKFKIEYQELHEEKKGLASELEKYRSQLLALKDRCQLKELELKETTRELDDHRKKAEEAKDQLGILPLDTKRV